MPANIEGFETPDPAPSVRDRMEAVLAPPTPEELGNIPPENVLQQPPIDLPVPAVPFVSGVSLLPSVITHPELPGYPYVKKMREASEKYTGTCYGLLIAKKNADEAKKELIRTEEAVAAALVEKDAAKEELFNLIAAEDLSTAA